jgi:Skp family chaperone for outer membrane proteins
MKKLLIVGLLSAGLAGFALAAAGADLKIATIDLRKAFDSYYKTIQTSVAIKQESSEVYKEHLQMLDSAKKHEEEWRKLIDKANDQSLSSEERDKSKRAAADKYTELETDKQSINQFDQMARTRLEEKERQRVEEIVKEIQGVVQAKAKAAGYSKVFDSSAVSVNLVQTPMLLYTDGQDDMTEAIIKELNAAAPPGSLDTNALAMPASTNLNILSPISPK